MKPIVDKITKEWVEKHEPCPEALDWYGEWEGESPVVILKKLIACEKYSWANWFIVRVMTSHDYVSYAVFAAKRVIDIYEREHPDDDRPRRAIVAAKKCIECPSEENKRAAGTAEAAWAAETAVEAAEAAGTPTLKKILDYGMGLLVDKMEGL